MKAALTPLRVGLLVIASAVILVGFLVFSRKGGLSSREAIAAHAFFRDGTGLSFKSRVQMAGIAVGEVTDIALEGGRARVSLRIRRSLNLRKDASLMKRAESPVLGDFVLDLNPGSLEAPALEEGDEILGKEDKGIDAVFGNLSAITADIQQVTSSLRKVLGGEKGEGSIESIVQNLIRLSEGIDDSVRGTSSRLDNILKNIEDVTADVRDVTAGEGRTVRDILQNIDVIARDVRDTMKVVKTVVGANEGELKEGVSGLKDALAKLDRSLQNVEEITQKVKEGKGALGSLVSDERIGQKVSDAVDDVSDYATRLTGMETEVGIKSDYLWSQGQAKNALSVRLIPKPDKYYLLEFVDDPRGSVETVYVQSNPPNTGSPVTQKQTITRDAIKFSAQFAKRYSWLSLRFGIIESTGGVGLDFSLPMKFFYYSRWIEDALVVKLDAFNFSVESLNYPRLRATLRFTPYEHIYVNVGVDDLMNQPNRDVLTNRLLSGRDIFIGAGISFTDADLKALLSVAPIPSVK